MCAHSHPWHLSVYGYLWSMAFGACGDGRWKEQTVSPPTRARAQIHSSAHSVPLTFCASSMPRNAIRLELFSLSFKPVPSSHSTRSASAVMASTETLQSLEVKYEISFLISWDIFIKTNIDVEELVCQMDPGKTFKVSFVNHKYISRIYLILSNASMYCINGWICIFHDKAIHLNTFHRQLYFFGFAIFSVEHF